MKEESALPHWKFPSGRFKGFEVENQERLGSELRRLNAAEFLVAQNQTGIFGKIPETEIPGWYFDVSRSHQVLCETFSTQNLTAFGSDDYPDATRAAGALIRYIRDLHGDTTPHVRGIEFEQQNSTVIIDATSRKNLEIESTQDGGQALSLVNLFDNCDLGSSI